MAPKSKSAWTKFQTRFKKDMLARGPVAAPGSAFARASAPGKKNVKGIRKVRVRPTGRSVFSTLAHGGEITDQGVGMGWEIVEVVENDDVVEAVAERERKHAEAEVAKAKALEEELKKARKAKANAHIRPWKKNAKPKKARNDDDGDGADPNATRENETPSTTSRKPANSMHRATMNENDDDVIRVPRRSVHQEVDDDVIMED